MKSVTKKITKIIKNPKILILVFLDTKLARIIPDKQYLKLRYKLTFNKNLNLENPQTFSEKIQWLKLYDRKPEYTLMVDKYEAKKYAKDIIGDNYIVKTLGVWENFDDIDFDKLPNQFVLKCTHDSGGLIICRDKKTLDIAAAKKKINKCLKQNYYWHGREWPYKNVKPRIIAEEYLEDSSTKVLRDYKFFCFNTEPKFIYISEGLENHKTAHISFYNLDGTRMPFKRNDFAAFATDPVMPTNMPEMIEKSKELAQNIDCPFVRTDFYSVNGIIFFSEITFSPCGGFLPFNPPEWDRTLGGWISLPEKK